MIKLLFLLVVIVTSEKKFAPEANDLFPRSRLAPAARNFSHAAFSSSEDASKGKEWFTQWQEARRKSESFQKKLVEAKKLRQFELDLAWLISILVAVIANGLWLWKRSKQTNAQNNG